MVALLFHICISCRRIVGYTICKPSDPIQHLSTPPSILIENREEFFGQHAYHLIVTLDDRHPNFRNDLRKLLSGGA